MQKGKNGRKNAWLKADVLSTNSSSTTTTSLSLFLVPFRTSQNISRMFVSLVCFVVGLFVWSCFSETCFYSRCFVSSWHYLLLWSSIAFHNLLSFYRANCYLLKKKKEKKKDLLFCLFLFCFFFTSGLYFSPQIKWSTHIYIVTVIHTNLHSYSYTDTYIHTQTHIPIFTYTHMEESREDRRGEKEDDDVYSFFRGIKKRKKHRRKCNNKKVISA